MRRILSSRISTKELFSPTNSRDQTEVVMVEEVSIPFRQSGCFLQLYGIVKRPVVAGRNPLVVISHGSPRSSKGRFTFSPERFAQVSKEFACNGWAAAVIARRGYGRSEGGYSESIGQCPDHNYEEAGLATAQDILQIIRFLRSQPYVDPNRVLLAGVSAGGFGSLAAAAVAEDELAGVINFAGGRGSRAGGSICRQDLLIKAFASYGKTIRAPSLWICAENDSFFPPTLVREMFAAFISAGAPGELVISPPFGHEGHLLFSDLGLPCWRAIVDRFTRKHGLLPFAACGGSPE